MQEIMFFGSFYTMEIEMNDFYILDQLHNTLQDMYEGGYDIAKLVERVSNGKCINKLFDIQHFPSASGIAPLVDPELL